MVLNAHYCWALLMGFSKVPLGMSTTLPMMQTDVFPSHSHSSLHFVSCWTTLLHTDSLRLKGYQASPHLLRAPLILGNTEVSFAVVNPTSADTSCTAHLPGNSYMMGNTYICQLDVRQKTTIQHCTSHY